MDIEKNNHEIYDLLILLLEDDLKDSQVERLVQWSQTDPDAAGKYVDFVSYYSIISSGVVSRFDSEVGSSSDSQFDRALCQAVDSGSQTDMDSNVSLDGIDVTKEVLPEGKEERVFLGNNIMQAMQELAEFEATAPMVYIEKSIEEPKKTVGSPVIKPAREKQKISKFTVFTLAFSMVAMLLFVAMVFFIPARSTVATLTDSIDAEWVDTKNIPVNGDLLNQGEMTLAKGFAEITFDDGAVVVVEAPAVIKLEGPESIFLASGRISAVVSEDATGFTVNTPSASIVDLGTEFGVIVEDNGSCSLSMFKGLANLIVGQKGQKRTTQRVNVNEARSVDLAGVVKEIRLDEKGFVRRINSEKKIVWRGGNLNLADIVGGGHGFGGGVFNCGINPVTGKTNVVSFDETPVVIAGNKFALVDKNKFIDCVFVPDGGAGQVVISSTGLIFDNAPDTEGTYWGNILNGAFHAGVGGVEKHNLKLEGVEYGRVNSPSSISLHSNKGITFDLDAIRNSMPWTKIKRFVSVCGISSTVMDINRNQQASVVDFWILVDGHMRYERIGATAVSGGEKIDIEISDSDRFLTIIVTDAGSTDCDWALFAEPALQIK